MKSITFPTFGRCAESPCFRLTFGRCAEASLHRERSVSVFLLPLHLSSALYPCFFFPCTFPTFGRCAESLRFRLTFGRCAEASLHRERPVSVFLLPLHLSHLRKVCRIPAFSPHLRKVRRSVTASRVPCIRVSSSPAPFPPSEGVQNPRVFASPSEGAQKRHCIESALYPCFFSPCTFPCIESALYPCFFSPCTFPTFGRCAESPCFRLTFGRWKVSLICWGISWCNILRIIFLSECAKYRQKNGVEWGSGNMAFIPRD